MSDTIIPSLSKDTQVPLYVAAGITSKESDAVYFEVNELLQSGKTLAEILKKIAENDRWNSSMKVWGAYNLHREIVRRQTPSGLKWAIDKLGW